MKVTTGYALLRVIMVSFLILTVSRYAMAQPAPDKKKLFAPENLVAWCIVPFDSKNRGPQERVEMLRSLGFTKYAYDWRHPHLDSFAEEIKLAKQSGIGIHAVWLWIDKNSDMPGKLSDDNNRLLQIMKDAGLKTQLWVGFNNNFFEDGDDAIRVAKGSEMVRFLLENTKDVSAGIGLYNHGDWFGEPENQIKIIRKVDSPQVGIIYNFHHGHGQVKDFKALVNTMKPWLWCVNINGMKPGGPQILTVGAGGEELGMLRVLKKSGYSGPIGILGHIETEDVEVVLKRNLEGLKKIEKQL